MNKPLSLKELNELVSEIIDLEMRSSYWLQAELSQVSENRGHCYLEFIEKAEDSDNIVAKAYGRCWASTWGVIKPYFERVTGQVIRPGMTVMVQVSPKFHPLYGFSWIVEDINPEFTMGDMLRKRNEIIAALKAEGVFDLQKELYLPRFCSRIAVISSDTAAGYGDFRNQLANNSLGLVFQTELFQCAMQGTRVETEMIAALNEINEREADFDCVVIIRGGGSTSDLSCFDTLALAENVANFPLPIITGIGHDRDESVLDLISFQRVKTPTAAAAFLIDWQANVLNFILNAEEKIYQLVRAKMEKEESRLHQLASRIPLLFSLVRMKQESYLDQLQERLIANIKEKIKNEEHRVAQFNNALYPLAQKRMVKEQHRMEILAERLKLLDPALLLKRGYSITLHNGKVVKDAGRLEKGDVLVTRLSSGSVESIVK